MNCVMVILNYNDSIRAQELADRCCKFSTIDKVVIVDNKSTDDSIRYFEIKEKDEIDLCFAKENGGFASGNNIGAKYVAEKYNPQYILFANTDTIFEDEDVAACIAALDSNDDLGLVSMRMKDGHGNEERAAWKYKTFFQYFLSNFWVYRHCNYMNDRYNYAEIQEFQYVDMVRGSFMLFRMEALKKAGYFDEKTFLYYEEECISYKLKRINYNVGIVTNHFYIHNHVSLEKEDIKFIKKTMDNSLTHFLEEYYHIGTLGMSFFRMAKRISYIEMIMIECLRTHRKAR